MLLFKGGGEEQSNVADLVASEVCDVDDLLARSAKARFII